MPLRDRGISSCHVTKEQLYEIHRSQERLSSPGFSPIFSTICTDQGGDQFYQFTELIFGLRPACVLFTKLMRPMVRYLRQRGHRVHPYFDVFLEVPGVINPTDFILPPAITAAAQFEELSACSSETARPFRHGYRQE